MYHVTVDNEIPYNVLGNKQDEPTYRGPSNSRIQGQRRITGIPRGMWHHVGGGESGFATRIPSTRTSSGPRLRGAGMVGGIVVRYEEDRRQWRGVEVWPEQSRGAAEGVRYRFVWDAPVHISPHDNETVYVGSQHVHRTRNRGQSWEVISPDLSLNDRSRMGFSGGLTGDNIGVEYAGTVFGIAESPIEQGLIWAGTNDGLLHVTRDNGATWTNVTENMPDLPEWLAVRSIAPSRFDPGTAYVAIDGHQMNVRDPYVYRTRDYGESFEKITDGIPPSMLSYTKIIIEDTKRQGLLYVGTENAIYVSFDDGDNWQPLQNNLPAAPVSGIVIQEHFNDLVVGTYGRGFWIFDDLAPLQQLTPEVMASGSHLFAPRDAYRFRSITPPSIPYDDPTVGVDPEYGAYLNYWLAAPADETPTVEIVNGMGAVVRTLEGSNNAGVNRIYWDLRDEPNDPIMLYTSPMYAEHIMVGEEDGPLPARRRFPSSCPPDSTRSASTWTERRTSSRSPSSRTRTRPGAKPTSPSRSLSCATCARTWWPRARPCTGWKRFRVQLETMARFAEDEALADAISELEDKLAELQSTLVDLRQTGQGQDAVRFEARLLSKLGYLTNALTNADFPPTDQEMEVKVILREAVQAHLSAVETMIAEDVAALNEMLRSRGLLLITDGGSACSSAANQLDYLGVASTLVGSRSWSTRCWACSWSRSASAARGR